MIHTDFLVIGSGIAGLMFALRAAEHGEVIVLCKRDPLEGSTRYAQGGIAAVIAPTDSFDEHVQDTLTAGAGLCDREIVNGVVREGPARIRDLISLGAQFDTERQSEEFSLGREGGHSNRRILHMGDMTGLSMLEVVYAAAVKHPNIRIRPYSVAIDLIHSDRKAPDGEVVGAYVLEEDEAAITPYVARCTLLATGGAGKAYLITSNPDVSTGDGIAMAYRAGAAIGNMEFFQFHPTCLYHQKAKSFLITEAMRGEGAKLLTLDGRRFMHEYHPDAELAPRDVVARAIDSEMKESGARHVLLDVSHLKPEFLKERFPTVYEKTLSLGIDIAKEPIPVVPAAHYCCGGVQCDPLGQTRLKRLYAAGECSFTGLHGANRLASNSLLEAVVYAERAAEHAGATIFKMPPPAEPAQWDYLDSVRSSEKVLVSHLWQEVRLTMWNLVGIVRSTRRLELAKRRIAVLKQEVREYYWKYRVTSDLVELRNVVAVAGLIVDSALRRRESRGLHYNTDFPEKDDTAGPAATLLVKQRHR